MLTPRMPYRTLFLPPEEKRQTGKLPSRKLVYKAGGIAEMVLPFAVEWPQKLASLSLTCACVK